MKQRDPAGVPKRSGKPAVAAPRKLLAAVSLLGASLGVSAAAPTEQIGGPERAAEAGNVAMKVAKRKALPPSPSHQLKSNQYKSDQKKGMQPAVQNPERK